MPDCLPRKAAATGQAMREGTTRCLPKLLYPGNYLQATPILGGLVFKKGNEVTCVPFLGQAELASRVESGTIVEGADGEKREDDALWRLHRGNLEVQASMQLHAKRKIRGSPPQTVLQNHLDVSHGNSNNVSLRRGTPLDRS
ncbi:hypothetical protein LZ30DRAFT_211464 [Colletotrichum cereale]|nr:hypothetical protein LZ30DRAFT_211464 [Colletotrichum cereale]